MFYDENENLIITCRGTTNFRDWVENFKFALIQHMDCDNGMIHRGYYNKLIRIISEKEFQKYISSFQPKRMYFYVDIQVQLQRIYLFVIN